MKVKDKRISIICFAVVFLILIFSTTSAWAHLSQPVTLTALGVFCILGSSIVKRNHQYKHKQDSPLLEEKLRRKIDVTISNPASSSEVGLNKQPSIINAFSIDLEEYFHTEVASSVVRSDDWDNMPSRLERSTMQLLDILDKSDTRATVFVLGWIARKYPHLVRHIAERGHKLGCHSDIHRLVYKLTPEEFMCDTFAAMDSIQNATGIRIQGYRAPSFSITEGAEWAFDCLAELGFTYDSSVYPVYHPTYGNHAAMRFPYYVADCKLLEIPVATWRRCGINLPVGGGAYLRLLPRQYIDAGIRSINNTDREPVTLYVHPWEIDSAQPRLDLKLSSQLRQTLGLSSMAGKLEHLLSKGSFAPIEEVYSNLIPQWHSDLLHLSSFSQSGVRV